MIDCERCQFELEDFLDGELDHRASAAIRAHLADCRACQQRRAELERETEIYTRFYEQTSLEPTPQMWEAIRAQIADREHAPSPVEERAPRRSFWSGFGRLAGIDVLRQAAFAAALVAVTVAVTLFLTRRPSDDQLVARDVRPPVAESTPNRPAAVQSTPAPEAVETRTTEMKTPPLRAPKPSLKAAPKAPPKISEDEQIRLQVARAEREYIGAIKLLDGAISRRRETLDPAVINQYERSLALIDGSIAESRRALRANPADASAGQFLLAAYARKVELMQEIALR